jgi:hypothetical protein
MLGYTKVNDAMSHNRLYGINTQIENGRFTMKLGSHSASQMVFSDPWGPEIHTMTYERAKDWLISSFKKEKGV